MKGLAKKTDKILSKMSELAFIKYYTLIGDTALSLQINHRLSEDLDFCIWSKNLKKDKPAVDWPLIQSELESIGKLSSRDVLGFDQVNFVINGVRLTFVTKQRNLSPVTKSVHILNNIFAADIDAIAAMKIELILRRSEFRDYYDIYSILKEGRSLKDLVSAASKYSNHLLKTRDALGFLANGSNFRKDKSFSLLEPVYDIDSRTIESFIKSAIRKEFYL
jgi:predicted nucleotidyltransferase component of viral defense system